MRLDPDELAAAALGRDDRVSDDLDVVPADPGDRADLAAYRRVVTIGRSITPQDRATHDPPGGLWDSIAEQISAAGPAVDHPVAAAPGTAGGGQVVALDSRRRTWQMLGAVAAAVVLIAGAAGLIISQTSNGGTELVASTDLAVLAGGGSGTAELVQRDDGLHLVVDVSDLTPAEQADFYELWLLTPDGGEPQSLTKFQERSGVIDAVVPPGVDTAQFPVVDISEEIDDGDTSHSGKSILRGTLA
jgi:anti-sigma-K factor RskA